MTARTLFHIVLKVLGIIFIKDVLVMIPAMLSMLYAFGGGNFSLGFTEFLLTLVVVFVHCLAIYYLVFKTDLVIDKLKLAEKVPEDPIPLNLHRSTVLTIAILITGFALIAFGIPEFVRGLTKWYRHNKQSNEIFSVVEPFDFTTLVVFAAQILIGLLLIGNDRLLVNFIEARQRRKNSDQDIDPDETE